MTIHDVFEMWGIQLNARQEHQLVEELIEALLDELKRLEEDSK